MTFYFELYLRAGERERDGETKKKKNKEERKETYIVDIVF